MNNNRLCAVFPWFDFQDSRFVFNNVNYNYTNSYLGSHFAIKQHTHKPYHSVKNIALNGALVSKEKMTQNSKGFMKRIGNLYNRIYDMDNLILADKLAAKGKSKQKGVIQHKANQEAELTALRTILVNKQFKTFT